MNPPRSFADVVNRFVSRSLYTPGQLSQLSDIPEETIVNWLKGRVKKPRQWQDLLKLATVLHLKEAEATELLQSAGHPSIQQLRKSLQELLKRIKNDKDKALLAPWVAASNSNGFAVDPAMLRAAQQHLETLPIDTIPDPAPLPSASRMPFGRNPLFVGRETDLLMLARALKGGGAVAISQVGIAATTGMGGIGKTQLAVEFVHRYGQYFAGGVFWLSFADPQAVPVEVAACGGADAMALRADFDQLSLDEQVKLVRAAWQSSLPRLLVFDNCEDEALLTQWRPPSGGCRVLVTSRRAQWDVALGVKAQPLDVLQRDESITLLRKFRPDLLDNASDLDAIAAELGDLPLALHLAGHYLRRYRHVITPASYLQHLYMMVPFPHPSLQSGGISPTGHVQHVARTFDLSYDQLDAIDPVNKLALALLARASFFAPGEPIPRNLLQATIEGADQDISIMLLVEDALARLLVLGLVDMTSAGAIRLHRLVAMFAKERIIDTTAQTAVEQTLLKIANRYNEPGDVTPMLPLQGHLRFVADIAVARQDEQAADLCDALGHHLFIISDYVGAQTYLEQALAIREQGQEHDELKLANSLELLGLLGHVHMNFEQSQAYFERVQMIRERLLGPEHVDTATAANNLGYLLLLKGDYALAQSHLQRALRIRHHVFGVYHYETARSLNNLGYLLFRRGLYTRARRCLKLALVIRRQVLAPNHIATAQTLNNLGEVLYAQSDYGQAKCCHEQALAMRKTLFGANHHDVAESYYNLGRVLHAQGDYNEARCYLEQALVIDIETLGADKGETALVFSSLGSLLRDQGEYSRAQMYLEQAIRAWQQEDRSYYHEGVFVLNNLGMLFQAQGNNASARSCFEQALKTCNKVLGDRHPDTATTLNNLGMLFFDQGDHAAARWCVDRALAIRSKVLGETHPDTAQSYNDLGILFRQQGDRDSARCCFERALEIFEQRFNSNHPSMQRVQANLAALGE
jgi:tetratricopeptide (TPR) repeat protein